MGELTSLRVGGIALAVLMTLLGSSSQSDAQFGISSQIATGGRFIPQVVDIALAPSGEIYALRADGIGKFAPDGTFVEKLASPGSGDGEIVRPQRIAVDATGNIYVADTGNHRVQKLGPSGEYLSKWGTAGHNAGEFHDPAAIAISESGRVFVAETGNDRVQVFTPDGNYGTGWGSPGRGDGQFADPTGIAVRDGVVYVADSGNARIQMFTESGTFLGAWGSLGRKNGEFSEPVDVLADPSGTVYVVDAGDNARMQLFTPNGAFVDKFGCEGTNRGQLLGPRAVEVDSDGGVYVLGAGFVYDYLPEAYTRIQHYSSPGDPIPCKAAHLRSTPVQPLRSLHVRVRCNAQPCDMTISGRVAVSDRKAPLKPQRLHLQPGEGRRLALELRQPWRLSHLRAYLEHPRQRGWMVLRLKTAVDASNNFAERRCEVLLLGTRSERAKRSSPSYFGC